MTPSLCTLTGWGPFHRGGQVRSTCQFLGRPYQTIYCSPWNDRCRCRWYPIWSCPVKTDESPSGGSDDTWMETDRLFICISKPIEESGLCVLCINLMNMDLSSNCPAGISRKILCQAGGSTGGLHLCETGLRLASPSSAKKSEYPFMANWPVLNWK